MEQKPLIGHLLEEIAAQASFSELAKFMDKIILENKEKFSKDFEQKTLAEILARMYSQGGETSLHDEFNRSMESNEMMNLVLEDADCIWAVNKIRGGHNYAQIPKIFTPLRALDEASRKQKHVKKLALGGITWDSTDLLLAAISRQVSFSSLCDILSEIEKENPSGMSRDLLLKIRKTLARAYHQGGELLLMAELNANNGGAMIILDESKTCFTAYDVERKGIFYQFESIFSPHRIPGAPLPKETLTE